MVKDGTRSCQHREEKKGEWGKRGLGQLKIAIENCFSCKSGKFNLKLDRIKRGYIQKY